MKKISFFILSALLLVGCATTKQTEQVQVQKARRIQAVPVQNTLEQVISAQPVFTSMQSQKAKFKIEYQQFTYSVNGAISMIRDSAIIFSLQPLLGIELYRLEIMPQHITLIDKINRKYMRMNYEQVKEQSGINLSFPEIQAIAMTQIFMIGIEQEILKEMNPQINEDTEHNIIVLFDPKIDYRFVADNQSKQLKQTDITLNDGTFSSTIAYRNHSMISDVLYPGEMQLSFLSGKQSGSCTISFQQLSFNNKVNVAPLDISKYTISPLSSFIK